MHEAHEPESSWHANVDPDSLELNANDALVEVVEALGPESIVVFGGVVSDGAVIVHVCVAGLASVLPAASVARTLKLCEPALSPLYALGLVHDANEPESSLHSKVEPASLEEKANDAPVEVVDPLGPESIVV